MLTQPLKPLPQPGLSLEAIKKAGDVLQKVVSHTPLQFIPRLSERYRASIYLKREDLQPVRSYKIRGAYYFLNQLDPAAKAKGVVCASAGNHAQGVAFSCQKLQIKGYIYMPADTPEQKVLRVKDFGQDWVEIILAGSNFDEALGAARQYCDNHELTFVHPFDNLEIITGQATVGHEIKEYANFPIDILIGPVGGGGLMSGVGYYFKNCLPKVKLIGAEPQGSPSMLEAVRHGRPVTLDNICTFIDGASVKTAGKLTWQYCTHFLDQLVLVPEGQVCQSIIEIYQKEGIIAEPAGALAIAALEEVADEIIGKNVVCILSGGNNDVKRYPEILKRSLEFSAKIC